MRGRLDPHGRVPEDTKVVARAGITEKGVQMLKSKVDGVINHFVNQDHVCETWKYHVNYLNNGQLVDSFSGINADEVRKHFPEIDLRVFYNFDLESLKLTSRKGMIAVIIRA
jgi:hypothetical protein